MQGRSVWEMFSLQNLAAESVRVQQDSPSLSSQHSEVKQVKISKPQRALFLGTSHCLPTELVNFIFLVLLAPPIPTNHGADFLTQSLSDRNMT
jgi:hypothetical protein